MADWNPAAGWSPGIAWGADGTAYRTVGTTNGTGTAFSSATHSSIDHTEILMPIDLINIPISIDPANPDVWGADLNAKINEIIGVINTGLVPLAVDNGDGTVTITTT